VVIGHGHVGAGHAALARQPGWQRIAAWAPHRVTVRALSSSSTMTLPEPPWRRCLTRRSDGLAAVPKNAANAHPVPESALRWWR